jgi:hypothetical protein
VRRNYFPHVSTVMWPTPVRAIKNRLKRQGNKGRKKGRGRPSKKAQQQRQRQGMTKKNNNPSKG